MVQSWEGFVLLDERRLGVFENRAYRGIFGTKRAGVTVEWRKLRTRRLMMCTPHIIIRAIKWRSMRWAGHIARMGAGKVLYRVLVGKSEG
jgi:hypothetical protein